MALRNKLFDLALVSAKLLLGESSPGKGAASAAPQGPAANRALAPEVYSVPSFDKVVFSPFEK